MMKWTMVWLGALVALQGTTVGASADDRKEIEAVYAKLRQAILHKNPNATLALETPDFVARQMGRRTSMTGKQLAAQMKSQDAMVRSIDKMEIHLADVAVRGKVASVTSNYLYAGKIVDRQGVMGPRGKVHVLSLTGLNHNTLVRTSGGWKFSSLEMGPQKMTVDGKPFNTGQARPSGPPK
ncbi:MAG TPA: DUF4440 domain-containing protein [Chthonomonadaceae bacterium]|nr:DUF4440 domain-containing protein [Chthonomonadaceae bacterium]